MGKKDPADPADVKGAAEIEGKWADKTARDTTYADRPDQYNSFGNIQWGQEKVFDEASGEWTTVDSEPEPRSSTPRGH